MSRGGTRGAWIATLAVIAVASFAAPAAAYVYWGNSQFNVVSIGRAELDGTAANQNFIGMSGVGGGPYFLAVDGGHIYWGTAFSIGRANLDGTSANPRFINSVSAIGVAVDSSYIYWSSLTNSHAIGRANLDGSNPDPAFITGVSTSSALAVDAGHIYWSDDDNTHPSRSIGRANIDGSDVDQTFIDVGTDYAYGIAVDAGHLYALCAGGSPFVITVCRANLDGTGFVRDFITGVENPTALAVDASHLYWADAATGGIGRANLDGSNPDPSFITGAQGLFGLAVDGGVTAPPPTITGVTPVAGAAAGGTTVTITGTDLAGATAVTFGSAAAAHFTVDSPTSITAVTPPGSGTVDVTVTTPGGTSATSPADRFDYIQAGPPPTVDKVSPGKGPAAGGSAVTITGTGFTGVVRLMFGTQAATSFHVDSATSITAVTPPGDPGLVHVTVTTPNGTSAVSGKDHFKYDRRP